MATLTDALSSSSRLVRITGDASAAHLGLHFRIDDEVMELAYYDRYAVVGGKRQPGVDPNRWYVRRGVDGSTAASHLAGADIFATRPGLIVSTSLTSPDPFASGLDLVLRQLGPTSLTLGPADIDYSDFTIPAGALLFKAFATVTDAGDLVSAAGTELRLDIRDPLNPDSTTRLMIYDAYNGFNSPSARAEVELDDVLPEFGPTQTNIPVSKSANVLVECDIKVALSTGVGGGTGSATFNIYAIIASPAS